MQFLTDLTVKDTDGAKWILTSPLIAKDEQYTYIVSTGFQTDFASIPKVVFWRAKSGKWNEAAVLHDAGYSGDLMIQPARAMTRADVDRLFLDGMQACGVNWLTRHVFYRAVRLGGGGIWARRRASLPEEAA